MKSFGPWVFLRPSLCGRSWLKSCSRALTRRCLSRSWRCLSRSWRATASWRSLSLLAQRLHLYDVMQLRCDVMRLRCGGPFWPGFARWKGSCLSAAWVGC